MNNDYVNQEEVNAFVRFMQRHRGKDNAIKTKSIKYNAAEHEFEKAMACDIKVDKRWVRRLVNAARLEGHPIIGGNEGYYMADCYDDISRMTSRLIGMSDELLAAAAALNGVNLLEYWRDEGNV